MDDPKIMNKLVFDYLSEHTSKKMASEFAKSVGKKNIQQKLDGIPSITHMVSELVKNNKLNGKRKVEETNGHGPKSKKSKPNSESDESEDSSSEEEEDTKKVSQAAKVNGVSKKDDESSSDDDSSDDEEEKKPTNGAAMNGKKKEESSSDDDSSDEEEEKKPNVSQKTVAKKEESSSEDDSSDDEDSNQTKKAKTVAKPTTKKEESSSSEESDSDDEDEGKKQAQTTAKKTKEESSSDEDSESDDEETEKKTESKPKKDDSSDDDDDDESEDSDDEDEKKKETPKKQKEKEEPMDVDDDFKITSNKTPNNSMNKGKANKNSENGGEFYIKMSGVPFRASVQELKDFFEGGEKPIRVEHSLNSDGRNSGHAFAAFASEQAAEQAMLKDRQYMGPRYVSLSRSDTFGTSQYTGQYSSKANAFDGNFSEFCVKLSGVPFKTTEQEVKDFFKGGDAPTKIQTIMNEEGRSSGEMLADFASEEAVQKALLKDREYIGSRFVILTRYTGQEEPRQERRSFGERGGGRGGRGGTPRGGQRGRGGRGGTPRGGGRGGGRGGFAATGANKIQIDASGTGANKKKSFGDD